jgi:GTP-binding protein HflX
MSWLHRHTEVIAKNLNDEGRLALTVRVDPAKAAMVKSRFGALARPLSS